MELNLKFFALLITLMSTTACNDNDAPKADDKLDSEYTPYETTLTKPTSPEECDESTTLTGKIRALTANNVNMRNGPSIDFEKVKTVDFQSSVLYATLDSKNIVFEECTKDGWSWVRVIDPVWYNDSHRGWVLSKFLDSNSPKVTGKYALKISGSAIDKYTKTNYPDVVERYGSRLNDIEKFKQKAAEMAIDSGKCDFVDTSELSLYDSSLDDLNFYVECRNGERVRLSETEISHNLIVLTDSERTSSNRRNAQKKCIDLIMAHAIFPSSVDLHLLTGTSSYTSKASQNLVLRIDFDAKNSFGNELPYTAICYFPPKGEASIEISAR